MANKQTYEEVLRFLIEAEGSADVRKLATELLSMGDAGEESEEKVASLLDKLGEAQGLTKAATEFRELGTEIVGLNSKYLDIQGKISGLTAEMAKTEEPTKRQQTDLKRLSGQLVDTGAELTKSRTRWAEVKTALESAGVSTAKYSTIAGQVVGVQERASAALKEYAGEMLATHKNTSEFTKRLESQNNALKEQGRTTLDVAGDLKQYEDRTGDAAEKTKELASEAHASSGIFSTLRGVVASVFGFFTVSKAIDGLKALVTEGSNSEQEIAQLEATLASTGRQAEFTAAQLLKMGAAVDKGLFSAGDITNAQTRLLSYTNIVGEQFPQALQVAIDQAQRLGISTEQSAEIVGKALQTPSKAMESLSKQGFVLSDSQKQLIKQLEATGQTAKAQSIIMDLLVESYGGAAAAASTGTILGLWQKLRDTWRDWQADVANRGVLNYFKDQIAQILKVSQQLANDGTLGRWAQQTADAIIRMLNVIKGGTRWLFEHRDAILSMGKAYAAFKIGQTLVLMNAWRVSLLAAAQAALVNAASVDGVTRSTTRLGTVLRAIPKSVVIAVGLVGVGLAIRYAEDLGEALAKNSEAAKHFTQVQEQMQQQMLQAAAGYTAQAKGLEEYANQTVLTAQQVANLSETERAGYEARAQGLRQYLLSLNAYFLRMEAAGALTPSLAEQWSKVQVRLQAVNVGLRDVAAGAQLAAAALENRLPAAAQLVIEKLEGIDRDGKLATSSIKALFDGLNFADNDALGNVGLALASIASEGAAADRNVREGLLATLQQLTGTELAAFQAASQAAFDELKRSPAEVATILDATLYAALEKLGVSAERMGTRFTVAGQDAVASFGAILENANATSAQIETAFSAALTKVATLDDAKALGALLQSAGEQGKIGFDQAARAAGELENRIKGITNAMDPLNNAFGTLGIKSQAELNRARDAAKDAFNSIVEGSRKGIASLEDTRRAFDAYANAARAAVADSDLGVKQRVENELFVQGAIVNSTRAMEEMGDAGRRAGSKVGDGAAVATDALDAVSTSARQAASDVADVGEASSQAGAAASVAAEQHAGFSFSMGVLSEAALGLLDRLKEYQGGSFLQRFADIWNEIYRQRQELSGLNDDLSKSAKAFDEFADRRDELRKRFTLLTDEELDTVIQSEQKIAQLREARAAKFQQENEKQRAADLARLEAMNKAADAEKKAGNAMNSDEQTLIIDWRAPSKSVATTATVRELEEAERIAGLVAPLVLARVERSRAVSIRRRTRS